MLPACGIPLEDLLHGHLSCIKEQLESLTDAVENMALHISKLERTIKDSETFVLALNNFGFGENGHS